MCARATIATSPLPRHRAGWLVAAALASACSYPKERGQALEQRVDRLDPLEVRVAALQRRVDALAAEPGPTPSDGARADALAAELAALRSGLADLARRVNAMDHAMAERAPAAPAPVVVPTPAPAAASAPPQPGRAAHARPARKRATPVAAIPVGGGALEAPRPAPDAGPPRDDGPLSVARDHEARGDLEVAKALYQEIAARMAGEPAAAEAGFRLGELAAREGRPREAAVLFGKVARDYPRSPRAPDALLRTAESMRAAGLAEEAATVLAEVRRRYPGTPAAARAEKLGQPDRARPPSGGGP
jgi:TolA-binding protein